MRRCGLSTAGADADEESRPLLIRSWRRRCGRGERGQVEKRIQIQEQFEVAGQIEARRRVERAKKGRQEGSRARASLACAG